MGRPPLLYLAPDGLHCYRLRRRTIEHIGQFAPDTVGQEAFSQWLEESRANTAFTLLVDLPDERFRIETLPHVRGPDRRRLRERRQAQIFPDTPYVAHQYLDSRPSGRREERVLFAALNRPPTIDPWLAIIERHGHRLRRLIPMPFLAATVIPHLPAAPGTFLLALRTPAGLRVSCFDGCRLLLSRLHPLPSHLTPQLSEWMAEAQEAHRHLLSQRLVAHDTQCPCYLLTPPQDNMSPAPELSIPHGDLHFILKDPAHLLPGTSSSASRAEGCLPMLLPLLQRHSRLPQATPGRFLLTHQLHQIGRALQATAAVILLACAAFAIANMREIQPLEQRSSTAKARGDAAEQALTTLVATSPTHPHSLAQLQITLETLQHLDTASSGPEPALRQLAVALNPIPDVVIRRIDWSANSSNAGATKETPTSRETLTLHFALPREGTRERTDHTQRILTALSTIPYAHLHTEQVPVEMMANRPLSPAVLEKNAQAADLVIRLEFPVTKP
ncbi:MAG: hypothetical protein JSR83_06215 [Proteobacteria bacterium]|nr:hypothetical protein [Pseudomonadota bacterium]